MYRPSIKSRRTLVIIALVALALYYICENTLVEVKASCYDQKIAAAKKMRSALEVLRDYRAAEGVFPEELGDPLVSVMIGDKYSQITTEEGLLSSKLTTLNPNFAGAVVEMIKESGAASGDKIAVAVSGSFPGLNLAVLSACQVLDLEPVVISSLGASSWGANNEDFTWLDMEKVLRDEGVFPYKSVAASIGGGGDIGIGLSQNGRALLREAIERNDVPLIEERELPNSIARRMEIYGNPKEYAAFINVGGGVASLGHPMNGDLIEPGFSFRLKPINYPGIGVINLFGGETPVIHLLKIEKLSAEYDLPLAPNPLPPVGSGKVFIEEKYDLRLAGASLIIIALMLAGIFRLDKRLFKLKQEGVDPDSLI